VSDSAYQWKVRSFESYHPQNRLNRSLVLVAPWVDAAILLVFFLLLTSRFVLQPGIRIRLPEAPFNAGASPYGLMAVVVVQEGADGQGEEEILYFDDARYVLSQPEAIDKLKAALSRAAHDRPSQPLILEADRLLRHGTLVSLINQASAAGIAEVYVASRPSVSGGEEP
jgi:biopolymer transport protein ExbD